MVALAGSLEQVLTELSTAAAHVTDGEDLQHRQRLLEHAERRVSHRLQVTIPWVVVVDIKRYFYLQHMISYRKDGIKKEH